MGKRSTNTTKSGKFMNPTDQARKEARKKELKKNKKQRLVVRAAVIKGKDPHQILADMERLDQMEYNIETPAPLNEKVLVEKRRKLKETWDRVLRLYIKEEKDKYLELKRIEGEYEAKRRQMQKFYESVMSARNVSVDDIPLPEAPDTPEEPSSSQEPIPILKKPAALTTSRTKSGKMPPGPPPGPPPTIDFGPEDEEGDRKQKRKGVSFVEDPKELDINDFLKEIEDVALPKEATAGLLTPSTFVPPIRPEIIQPAVPMVMTRPPPLPASLAPVVPPPSNSMVNASILMPRPPPPIMRGAAIPPPPSLMGLSPHQRNNNPNLMPLMRPPAMPTTGMRHPMGQGSMNNPLMRRDDRRGSGPSPSKDAHVVSDRATIEAKPQLRNLSADATRFTPVSLRVKRTEKQTKKPDAQSMQRRDDKKAPKRTTDDAYDDFMKEMQGFL